MYTQCRLSLIHYKTINCCNQSLIYRGVVDKIYIVEAAYVDKISKIGYSSIN